MAKEEQEKHNAIGGSNVDIDLGSDASGKELQKFTPNEIEGMIGGNLLYLDKVKFLRDKLQKEDIKTWDELEKEARKPAGAVSLYERRKLLRRLEDFTLTLTELDSLLERQKRKWLPPEAK